MSWEERSINSITEIVTKGTTPSTYGYNFIKEGVNYIRAEAISKDGRIKEDTFLKISSDCHEKLKRSQLKSDDILFSIAGMALGKTGIVKGNYLPANTNQAVAIIRPIKELINPRFLQFQFINPNFYELVNKFSAQAAQPNINLTQLKSLSILTPPLQTQKRIADILSAFDDLIENNLKRIKLLEQAAQNIYKEWFVNLRFPGHENTPINEETRLPLGWEEKKLSDYIDFKEGPGLRNWQFRTEGIPFLNIRMMSSGNLNFNSVKYLEIEEVERKYAHFLLKEFDHIVSTSGTLGKVVTIRKSHLPLCLNTSIIRFRPKQISIGKWYIKRKISSTEFLDEMRSFATGSAQLNFGPKHLNMMNIIVPMEKTGKEYERITNPMELKIISLLDYNQKLKAARDILLPRLMNRTIEV